MFPANLKAIAHRVRSTSTMSVVVLAILFPADCPQAQTAEVDAPPGHESYPAYEGLYVAAGWGHPFGICYEFGRNLGSVFSVGLTVSAKDTWSNDPGAGKLGVLVKLNLLQGHEKVVPFILLNTGGTFSPFGSGDNYFLFQAGSMIHLGKNFLIRPAIGMATTSRHVSGGFNFLTSSPEVREQKVHFCANCSIEFDW